MMNIKYIRNAHDEYTANP